MCTVITDSSADVTPRVIDGWVKVTLGGVAVTLTLCKMVNKTCNGTFDENLNWLKNQVETQVMTLDQISLALLLLSEADIPGNPGIRSYDRKASDA